MNSFVRQIALSITALPALAAAQTPVQLPLATAQPGYWTAERFKAAKPLDLPRASPDALRHQFEPSNNARPESRDGSPPKVPAGRAAQQLFVPGAPAMTVAPQAHGTALAHYTSTRVFPMYTGAAYQYSTDFNYPHRTVGKLFFTIGDQGFSCSASVIAYRIVATAGHCVHSGTATGFYSNFVFAPAFRDGTAPLSLWTPRLRDATVTWKNGGGTVPNAADYAMMEMNDQVINGVVRRIGEVTGWLGWQTNSLAKNHTSKLGYPGNLDSGQKMQNAMSGEFQAVAPNTMTYGSDLAGGSSGGPWVQNLEVVSVGQTGLNLGSNRVVGIQSYGPVSPDPKYSGSSILDNRWSSMYSAFCAARAGNC